MQQFCLSYGSNSGLIFELNKEVAKIVIVYHVLKKSADAISFLKKLRNILKIMLSMWKCTIFLLKYLTFSNHCNFALKLFKLS